MTKDDLESMLKKEFTIKRLEEVRDIFVFSYYTGISYIDVSNHKKMNIERNNENELWVRGQRQKTNTNFSVPLLPSALKNITEILATSKSIKFWKNITCYH